MDFSSAPVVALNDVAISQEVHTVLSHVTLEVQKGEFVYLVGRTGSGKSSLLKTLYADLPLYAGTAYVADFPVHKLSRSKVPYLRRKVGIVFQDFQLLFDRTVADNMRFVLRATGWSDRSKIKNRIAEVLMRVGLDAAAPKMPHQLSGGEQQRVAIARALALNPEVVLLDEPFSQLDRGLAARVRDEAIQALRAAGASVVLVTHDQDEALAVGDRVAVLQAGRLVQLAEPEEVFHRPINRFVSTFLGEADFVSGLRQGVTAETVLGTLPVIQGADGDVEVMTRPHDLTVVPLLRESASGVEGGAGVVQRVEFRGGDVLHHVTLDAGPSLRALTSHTHKLAVGQRVLVPTPVAHPLTAFEVNCPTHRTPPTYT